MKAVLGPTAAAVVLAVLGGVFWIAGLTERRLARAHAQLAMLRYAAAKMAAGDLESTLALDRRVPVLGFAAEADLRYTRATVGYWRAEYAAIAPQQDAAGIITETDPAILFLSANAAFRVSQAVTDHREKARRLDDVIAAYARVLRTNCETPAQGCEFRTIDAAYNYEYAIRAREAAANAKPVALQRTAAVRAAPEAMDESNGDLPAGPTLHGKRGGPPLAVDMNQFKIVIPRRDDERTDTLDAGKGGAKVRKG